LKLDLDFRAALEESYGKGLLKLSKKRLLHFERYFS
jgi:hypothetical protein